jgi:voltage-gated potassium channel
MTDPNVARNINFISRQVLSGRERGTPTSRNYAALLITLLVLFFLYPLIGYRHSGPWTSDFFTAVSLVIVVYTIGDSRSHFFGAIFLAVPVLLSVLFDKWFDNTPFDRYVLLSQYFFSGALQFYTALLILKDILFRREVSLQHILGAVSVYFLIGFVWASIFAACELLSPGSIVSSLHASLEFPDILYFSFTNLTSLGYGDILPVHHIARSFASLEGITGQLYLTILIARIVGLHISSEGLDK